MGGLINFLGSLNPFVTLKDTSMRKLKRLCRWMLLLKKFLFSFSRVKFSLQVMKNCLIVLDLGQIADRIRQFVGLDCFSSLFMSIKSLTLRKKANAKLKYVGYKVILIISFLLFF